MKPEDIPEGEDPVVSLVVFEWQDKHLIGKPVDDDVSTLRNPIPTYWKIDRN
jgi:hypothetical protein